MEKAIQFTVGEVTVVCVTNTVKNTNTKISFAHGGFLQGWLTKKKDTVLDQTTAIFCILGFNGGSTSPSPVMLTLQETADAYNLIFDSSVRMLQCGKTIWRKLPQRLKKKNRIMHFASIKVM